MIVYKACNHFALALAWLVSYVDTMMLPFADSIPWNSGPKHLSNLCGREMPNIWIPTISAVSKHDLQTPTVTPFFSHSEYSSSLEVKLGKSGEQSHRFGLGLPDTMAFYLVAD